MQIRPTIPAVFTVIHCGDRKFQTCSTQSVRKAVPWSLTSLLSADQFVSCGNILSLRWRQQTKQQNIPDWSHWPWSTPPPSSFPACHTHTHTRAFAFGIISCINTYTNWRKPYVLSNPGSQQCGLFRLTAAVLSSNMNYFLAACLLLTYLSQFCHMLQNLSAVQFKLQTLLLKCLWEPNPGLSSLAEPTTLSDNALRLQR